MVFHNVKNHIPSIIITIYNSMADFSIVSAADTPRLSAGAAW